MLAHTPPTVNQDCACIAHPLEADEHAAAFIVLDGHGKKGHVVSAQALYSLHGALGECLWDDAASSEAQLLKAFERAEESLMRFECDAHGTPVAQDSGAVGVVLVLRKGMLHVAHVGDARAVLGREDHRGEMVAEPLTEDHVPDMPSERLRIEATGGWVRAEQPEPDFAPCRFYHSEAQQRRGPGLSMSRSLGDLDALPAGLIATPTVRSRRVQPEDRFIVIASDGLWEFLPNDDVVSIVSMFIRRGKPAIDATKFLIAKAALAWRTEEGNYRDDITVIVIYLKDLPMTST